MSADDKREILAEMFYRAEFPMDSRKWRSDYADDGSQYAYDNAYSRADEALAVLFPPEADDWEYGVDDVGMHPEGRVWAYRGVKRPINLEVTLGIPGRLRHWYGVDLIYRRRKAGAWEIFDHTPRIDNTKS